MAKIGNQGDGGGAPLIVFTEQQKDEVERLGAVLSIEQIADFFGIGRTTMFAIFKRDEEVLERYKKGKAKAIGNVSAALLKKALKGNIVASIFYLKTQAGWKETQAVEVSGKDGGAIKYQTLDDFYNPDDEADGDDDANSDDRV